MTRIQGHKVNVRVKHGILRKQIFAFNSWTDICISMKITCMIDIDKNITLTQGQGHKIKGEGQTCSYAKHV